MEQKNWMAGQKNYHHNSKEELLEVKKKTLTSKILKSPVDAPCSTRTIRSHLNHEKIKHKKRIHCPWLTIKHKEKWLEYACQYQTMSAKE